MRKTYLYTFLGITLNAIGNSLNIVTNLGSILWPASIVNMMHALHWTMWAAIFTEGIVISLLTMLLEERVAGRVDFPNSLQHLNAALCDNLALGRH